MARYIDADKLFRYVDEQTHLSKGKLAQYIRENHTTDVVEVVRCRACKCYVIREDAPNFCMLRRTWTAESDYCSRGERS